MTTKTFRLPDLGEGLTEADLITWNVAVGDEVTLNQIIAEVETAKASVELPSPYAGVIAALHADAGDTITVGNPFVDFDVADESPAPAPPESPATEAPASAPVEAITAPETDEGAPKRTPVLVGYGVAEEGSSRRRASKAGSRNNAAAVSEPAAAIANTDRPLAKPSVRRSARENGIDLAAVAPSGAHGDVTATDLEAYRDGHAHPSAASTSPRSDEERFAIKGVRKHTAAAMVASAFSAPHVTEFVDVDMTETMALLGQLKESTHFAGVRLTPLTLVAKALLVALRNNPTLNSSWLEDSQEIAIKHYVNLGIAAATPRGLMVPNIKDAHALGLNELAVAINDLTATAKEGKSGPESLADGTISITNIGVFGIDSGTPILNPGEAAILCFGAIRERPWVHNGEIAVRRVTTLSLSFDHRLVDGQQGSQFLAAIADMLSDPVNLVALS